MITNDEAHLSFQYDGETIEFSFPTKILVSAIVNRLWPRIKKYIQTLGDRFGPITYIVDVGACAGTWAIPLAFYFPEAKMLAIEPSKYNYPYLLRNCKNYPNIKTLKMAVSNTKGKIEIASPTLVQRDRSDLKTNTGLISVHGQSDNFREEIEMDILDDLVEGRVDWLKIDVEGHEVPVLNGAKNILKNHRPLIQVEARNQNQKMAKNTTFALLNLVSSYNYVSVGMVDDDWIFVPQEKM